jgi:WD40 repeat protein
MTQLFISHVEEDAQVALEIAARLEAAGYTTWYYERDSMPGPSYLQQISTALSRCEAVLVLVSPASVGSHQVNTEVIRVHELSKPFVPVLLGMSHTEFQQARSEWAMVFGAATSVVAPASGAGDIGTRIAYGLAILGIKPATLDGPAKDHELTKEMPAVAAMLHQHLEYLDFDVEIAKARGRSYAVEVRSPAGEARATMRFPFDASDLQTQVMQLQQALLRSRGSSGQGTMPEEQGVQEFGAKLFDALLSSPLRSKYDASHLKAKEQHKGLRLKLRIHAPELAAVPWEFLYDDRRGEHVSLSLDTPVVRFLEVAEPVPPLPVTLPLRILGMIASPDGQPSLDVTHEQRRLEDALEPLRASGRVELEWLERQTWDALYRELRPGRGPWHVFHFIGHGGLDADAGESEGMIALADEEGQPHRLHAAHLARLLRDHKPLRLVLLNIRQGTDGSQPDICARTSGALVRGGIPAVLSMPYETTDQAAIMFARWFYEAVADDLPVDAAVADARKAVSLARRNTLEWGTPMLHMRTPDGHIFDLATAHSSPEPAVRHVPVPAPPASPRERAPGRAMAPDAGAGASRGTAVATPAPPAPPVAPATAKIPAVSAAPAASAVAAVDDQHLGVLYTRALSLYWTEKWDEALALFQAIVGLRPDYEDAAAKLEEVRRQQQLTRLFATAQRAFGTQAWNEAIDQLSQIVALDPNFRGAASLLEQAQRQKELVELYAEARHRHQAQDWPAVVEVFDRIHAIDRTYADPDGLLATARDTIASEARRRQAAALYTEGVRHLEGGDLDVAYARLLEVQRLDPAYEQVGAIVMRVERDIAARKAEEAQRAAEAQRRQQLTDLYDEAESAIKAGAWDRATEPLEAIIALDPHYRDAAAKLSDAKRQVRIAGYFAAGIRAYEAQAWNEAVAQLTQLVALDPNYRSASTLLEQARRQQVRFHTLTGHDKQVNCVAFSPDGQTLASGSDDRTVRLWQVANGATLRVLEGHGKQVNCVAFSPDGQTLASTSGSPLAGESAARLWRVADRSLLRNFTTGSGVLAGDNTVRLWRVNDGSLVRTLEGHTSMVKSVAFSLDGQTLASGSDDKTVRLWRVASGATLRVLEGHSKQVNCVAFSHDGQTLASASGGVLVGDNTVRLWRVASGALLLALKGHAQQVNGVAFSPDGHTLASASDDKTVRLWRVSDGSLQRILEGHGKQVNCVAFSPDGQTLASASDDRTVRLWRVSDGSLLKTLTGHTSLVKSVAFAPEGTMLASGSDDKTAQLWDSE